jgi:hypothetical protein
MLLRAKIAQFSWHASDTLYHARVDKLPSSYEKADERALKIINSQLLNQIGSPSLRTLFTRDSKATLGIQLADLFLGP